MHSFIACLEPRYVPQSFPPDCCHFLSFSIISIILAAVSVRNTLTLVFHHSCNLNKGISTACRPTVRTVRRVSSLLTFACCSSTRTFLAHKHRARCTYCWSRSHSFPPLIAGPAWSRHVCHSCDLCPSLLPRSTIITRDSIY